MHFRTNTQMAFCLIFKKKERLTFEKKIKTEDFLKSAITSYNLHLQTVAAVYMVY